MKNNIRWKAGTVPAEQEHFKDKDAFVFSALSIHLNSQLFFATQIHSEKKKIPIEEDVEALKEEQPIDEMILRQKGPQLEHATSPKRCNSLW